MQTNEEYEEFGSEKMPRKHPRANQALVRPGPQKNKWLRSKKWKEKKREERYRHISI